jgi:hypothetical protein
MVVGRIKATGYRASPRSDFKEADPFQSPRSVIPQLDPAICIPLAAPQVTKRPAGQRADDRSDAAAQQNGCCRSRSDAIAARLPQTRKPTLKKSKKSTTPTGESGSNTAQYLPLSGNVACSIGWSAAAGC